jgi:hypothetical protein
MAVNDFDSAAQPVNKRIIVPLYWRGYQRLFGPAEVVVAGRLKPNYLGEL